MNQEIKGRSITRRKFAAQAGKAGLALLGAAGLGIGLYDSKGPAELTPSTAPALSALPDFSLPQMTGKMAIIKGRDRVKSLETGFKALGGIGAFVKPGDGVLIKVNAAFASPPILAATTNPELVSALIRLCQKAGARRVVVADNPIQDPASCFTLSGIGQAAEATGAKLMLPRSTWFAPFSLPGGRLIKNWPLFYEPFKGINKVIGLAPVKDHHRSGASLTMKNWYGLLGGERSIFHQDIHGIITELAMMVKPTLVILDGVESMITNGPTGGSLSDLKATETLILSTDQVAADALGIELLGKTLAQAPFIAMAARAGLGAADYNSLRPIRASAG